MRYHWSLSLVFNCPGVIDFGNVATFSRRRAANVAVCLIKRCWHTLARYPNIQTNSHETSSSVCETLPETCTKRDCCTKIERYDSNVIFHPLFRFLFPAFENSVQSSLQTELFKSDRLRFRFAAIFQHSETFEFHWFGILKRKDISLLGSDYTSYCNVKVLENV